MANIKQPLVKSYIIAVASYKGCFCFNTHLTHKVMFNKTWIDNIRLINGTTMVIYFDCDEVKSMVI